MKVPTMTVRGFIIRFVFVTLHHNLQDCVNFMCTILNLIN